MNTYNFVDVFTYEGVDIRVIGTIADPWLSVSDIGKILLYKNTCGFENALKRNVRDTDLSSYGDDAFVNENGALSMVSKCRLKTAKKFELFLRSELKSLRRSEPPATKPVASHTADDTEDEDMDVPDVICDDNAYEMVKKMTKKLKKFRYVIDNYKCEHVDPPAREYDNARTDEREAQARLDEAIAAKSDCKTLKKIHDDISRARGREMNVVFEHVMSRRHYNSLENAYAKYERKLMKRNDRYGYVDFIFSDDGEIESERDSDLCLVRKKPCECSACSRCSSCENMDLKSSSSGDEW